MDSPPAAPHPQHLLKSDYVALASFRYALRQFLRFSEEAAVSAGLSTQQHQALLAIRGYPADDGVSVGQLAERLQIRHHSAVGLVDRLAGSGLVKRDRHTNDARKVAIVLTPSGEAILESLSAAHRAELRRTGPDLLSLLESLVVGDAGCGKRTSLLGGNEAS